MVSLIFPSVKDKIKNF
jgi:hypothetical protein